jgi:hypothetical protein
VVALRGREAQLLEDARDVLLDGPWPRSCETTSGSSAVPPAATSGVTASTATLVQPAISTPSVSAPIGAEASRESRMRWVRPPNSCRKGFGKLVVTPFVD